MFLFIFICFGEYYAQSKRNIEFDCDCNRRTKHWHQLNAIWCSQLVSVDHFFLLFLANSISHWNRPESRDQRSQYEIQFFFSSSVGSLESREKCNLLRVILKICEKLRCVYVYSPSSSQIATANGTAFQFRWTFSIVSDVVCIENKQTVGLAMKNTKNCEETEYEWIATQQ